MKRERQTDRDEEREIIEAVPKFKNTFPARTLSTPFPMYLFPPSRSSTAS